MLDIVIPRDSRNYVRALIRNHPDFESFRLANGAFDSRDLSKEITMKAIEALNLESAVRVHIEGMESRAASEAPETGVSQAQAPVSGVQADSLAQNVIDPLKPFLSPTLLDTVAKALEPLVALANKPASVQTVIVDENGAPVVVALPHAVKTGESTIGKLFGLPKFSHSKSPVSLWNDVSAPAVNPIHVFEPELLANLVTASERGKTVWLAGPASSGKSTTPEQMAARQGRGFVEIAITRAVDVLDLVGSYALDGKGGQVWKDGILTQAIRRPGTYVLIDEPTFAAPGVTALFQTLLASRSITIHATGERVPVAPGVVFFFADNTNGCGDDSGVYAGTNIMNAALIDRAARLIMVDYLPADLEAQALANHTRVQRAACDHVVAFVNNARKLPGFENRPLGLRRMTAFIEMCQDRFAVVKAFTDTFLTCLPDAEREALRMFFETSFDVKAFETAMSGSVPVKVSDAPEQVIARSGVFTEIDQND